MNYRELEEVLGYDLPCFGDGDDDATDPRILRRLSQNDPVIQSLWVDCFGYQHDNRTWLKEVGRAISKNTHLRSLSIEIERLDDDSDNDDDDEVEEEEEEEENPPPPFGVRSLIMGLAENRSINDLFLDGFYHSHMDIDVFKILAPFFEHNRNLRSICINGYRHLRERIPSLISALKKAHGLQYICISKARLEDSIAADLINALQSMPRLHHLLVLDLGGNKIGQQGCRALRELLRHPSCKIQCLDIGNNHLDNVCMDILYGGLVTNNLSSFFISVAKSL